MKQVLYSFALFGALTVAAPAAIGQTNKTATTTRSLVNTVNAPSSSIAADLLEKQRSVFAPGQRTPVANNSGERGGPVANDDCAGAIMLTVGTACVGAAGTVDGATESQPSDTCSNFTSSLITDVWYSFTANSASTTVQVTGDTLAAITDGYDAVLAIYEGSCGALTLINCVDATVRGETETLTIATVPGTTYYYRTYFYNYMAAQTVFGFSTCVFGTPAPPVNDQCSSVTPTDLAVGSSVSFSGTTAWATADGDYVQSALLTDPAVWHAITTTECSELHIDYCGSVPLLSDFYVVLATTCPLDTGAIVFNTLNNLYGLALERSDKTPELLLRLSDLMSYLLYESGAETVSLRKELDILEAFIELEKLRHGDRAAVIFEIKGEANSWRIPPLLLLPFVENAFKHGLKNGSHTCRISIALNIQTDKLCFEVRNDLLERPDVADANAGVGLENVRRRLALLLPDRHRLETGTEEGQFFILLKIQNKAA